MEYLTVHDLKGLSVNFHLNKECNARCRYCFAGFASVNKTNTLSDADRSRLIDLLVDAGVGKINFAGGEPTLVRNLGDLCRRIKDRSAGRCAVSIVSNGFRLPKLIEESGPSIDWAAVSLDSGDSQTNVDIGRVREPDADAYAERMLKCGDMLRSHGIRVKCNTVVNRCNVDEDMSGIIRRLAPERWKVFQALPVRGENDGTIDGLEISEEEFEGFVARHRRFLTGAGVEIVPENNEAMTNSYVMIDPKGRFYWHEPEGGSRRRVYGDPILEIGLEKALERVRFSRKDYEERDALYEWRR